MTLLQMKFEFYDADSERIEITIDAETGQLEFNSIDNQSCRLCFPQDLAGAVGELLIHFSKTGEFKPCP